MISDEAQRLIEAAADDGGSTTISGLTKRPAVEELIARGLATFERDRTVAYPGFKGILTMTAEVPS